MYALSDGGLSDGASALQLPLSINFHRRRLGGSVGLLIVRLRLGRQEAKLCVVVVVVGEVAASAPQSPHTPPTCAWADPPTLHANDKPRYGPYSAHRSAHHVPETKQN